MKSEFSIDVQSVSIGHSLDTRFIVFAKRFEIQRKQCNLFEQMGHILQ